MFNVKNKYIFCFLKKISEVCKSNINFIKLFLISFISLFLELIFIRWLPDSVHILSFFGNFTLLSVFLGLGIGLLIDLKNDNENKIFRQMLVNLFILIIITAIFNLIDFGVPTDGEYVFNEDYSNYTLKLNAYFIIGLFTVLTTMAFIPIGKMINLYFRKQQPLISYSINIGGSLSAILVFSLFSYFSTPVWFWISINAILLIPFSKKKVKFIVFSMILISIIIISNLFYEKISGFKKIWSAYYCLKLKKIYEKNYVIIIGNSFQQCLFDLNDLPEDRYIDNARNSYELPYKYIKNPDRVLILGSGMGNDVAAALKNGAKNIDAVEIDPKIIELGKKYHPNKPYFDKRVNIIINDARNYVKNTKCKYDLIVFGTVDSHALFSQMSSIKMENYLYTVESLEKVKNLLKNNGLIYVNMGFIVPYIGYRLYNTLDYVFAKKPVFFISSNPLWIYLSSDTADINGFDFNSPSMVKIDVKGNLISNKYPESLILPTDDWPHLFLKEKKISKEYLYSILLLLVISVIFIIYNFRNNIKPSLNYFLMGAGFMLLEAKSITEMGLIFGVTWFVNSIVIASILLTILAINLILIRYNECKNIDLIYIILFLGTISAYYFNLDAINIENDIAKTILASVFISVPIIFASLIFLLNFKNSGKNASYFLASNMIGSVFGGLLEYISMIYGLKFLYIIVLIIYFLSFILSKNE